MELSSKSPAGRFISAVARSDRVFQPAPSWPASVLGRLLYALFNPISYQPLFQDASPPYGTRVAAGKPGRFSSWSRFKGWSTESALRRILYWIVLPVRGLFVMVKVVAMIIYFAYMIARHGIAIGHS